MNHYMIICRLRWPALLLLTGVIALCHQFGILSVGHAWPLYLILLGVLALAEHAALASDPAANNFPYGGPSYLTGYQPGYGPQAGAYPQGGYPAAPGASPVEATPASVPSTPATSIVPVSNEIELRAAEHRADFRNPEDEEKR